MKIFSFGEYIDGKSYKVLDERIMRGSAGIMFLVGLIASINGFALDRYVVIPFAIGAFCTFRYVGIFPGKKTRTPTYWCRSKEICLESRSGFVGKHFCVVAIFTKRQNLF
jgi:hypothetical protein